jgi:YD repeat-containing protein
MKNIMIIFTLLSANAFAQTQYYYGPQGQAQGTANQSGNTTYYYGPQGQAQGTATQSGNTTYYYGPEGQSQGTAINQSAPPIQNNGYQQQPYRPPSNRSSY